MILWVLKIKNLIIIGTFTEEEVLLALEIMLVSDNYPSNLNFLKKN
jgi:hypothetical protein